ncbi:MAG: EAL domain protein [Marinobacter excellens HL-55]|uniref:EAL domain protein n=1 Tax=Marinobacter excellens HL-55 TaxID=1305731 RepID=A0A0P7Z3I9_9GAMM|nr:MAG: EAL domain protein [Marinobacter excellens HL-55]
MKNVLRLAEHRQQNSSKSACFIEHHDFNSVYQPILSPTHQKLVGYEALIRVKRGNQNIPPTELFEQASIQGVTTDLDRHLLNLHLDNFGLKTSPVWLFININPDTLFHHADYLGQLADQCRQVGLHPERIVLELVETATRDTNTLLEFVQEARDYGFQIAIDDFGMGDSNFERLWRINPLIVKIDRSLLANAEKHQRARLLLHSLVRMIRESGSLVLLEGIENDAQARIALDTEADLVQGFLFARPKQSSRECTATAENVLKQIMSKSEQSNLMGYRSQETFLKLLRFEMMEACHQLVRGESFDKVCRTLLEIEGVKRCFLLNSEGVQQGSVAHRGPLSGEYFNPLYHSSGARWSHREYFRNALERPQKINSCRPYVALPDARRTVTLSTSLSSANGQTIFCVDIHPDDVLDGQLLFPPIL